MRPGVSRCPPCQLTDCARVTAMRQVKSLVLPFSALVIISGLILFLSKRTPFGINMFSKAFQIAAGALICLIGLLLMVITIRMFILIGRGTLAPWDPTSRLITGGIYAHVRNPMISGVLITLLGEALVLGSAGILIWAVIFFVANTLYFHYSEEKGLEKRFGDEYLEYKKQVPMWVPRRTRWKTPTTS